MIVYCGYEGIDQLFWAGSDPQEVFNEMRRLRGIAAHIASLTDEERWGCGHYPYPWLSIDDPEGRRRNAELLLPGTACLDESRDLVLLGEYTCIRR